MAISLGDAALAFAGGAATEYNTQQAEKRQSATRMEERNKELAEMHQYRVAETRFANQLEQDVVRQRDQQAIQSLGGPDSVDAQMYVATQLFGDRQIAARRLSQGWKPDMSRYTTPVRVENTIADGKMAVEGDQRLTRRFSQFGDVARSYIGDNLETAEIRPDSDTGTLTTMEQRFDRPADSDALSAYAPPAPSEFKAVGGQLAEITPDGRVVYHQTPSDTKWEPVSPEGKKTADLQYLRDKAASNPDDLSIQSALATMEQLLSDDPSLSLQKGTIMEDGTAYDAVVAVRTDPELGAVAVGEPVKIGIDTAPGGGSTAFGQRRISELESSNRGIATTKKHIAERMSFISPSQEGLARAGTILTNVVASNLQGLAEMAGVPRETSADRLQEMYQEAGMDMDSVIAQLRDSNSYLVGMSDQNLGMLAYSLGGILKDTGTRRETSEKDIQRAVEMVGRLSSRDSGIAAAGQLMHFLDVRMASNNQMIYTNPNASADVRATAGVALAKSVNENITEEHLLEDTRTGTVYVFFTPEDKAQAVQTLQQMFAQPDAPTTLEGAINKFPEQLRPDSIDDIIRMQGQDGFLLPPFDESRYLEQFMNQQR